MSRLFSMGITVTGAEAEKLEEIIEAIGDVWELDDGRSYMNEKDNSAYVSGDDYLYGGESDEEFAGRIAKIIWNINGGHCDIDVASVGLGSSPTELFEFKKDEYTEYAKHIDE